MLQTIPYRTEPEKVLGTPRSFGSRCPAKVQVLLLSKVVGLMATKSRWLSSTQNHLRVPLQIPQPRASALLLAGNITGRRLMGGESQRQGRAAKVSRRTHVLRNKPNCSPLLS